MKGRSIVGKLSLSLWKWIGDQCSIRAPSPHSSPVKGEEVGSDLRGSRALWSILTGVMLFGGLFAAPARAQTLEQIVTEAKKEGEVTLVASASTFGGKKGFAELE